MPRGAALITGGPRCHIFLPSQQFGHAALLLLKWSGEKKRACSYIRTNALCPCVVSPGRWCIAQQSRTNGQMKQRKAAGIGMGTGRAEDEGISHFNVKDGWQRNKKSCCHCLLSFTVGPFVDTVWTPIDTQKPYNIIYSFTCQPLRPSQTVVIFPRL